MLVSLTRRIFLFLAVVCLTSFSLIFLHSLHEGSPLTWQVFAGAAGALLVIVCQGIALIKADDYLIPRHARVFFVATAALAMIGGAALFGFFTISDAFPSTYFLYFGIIPLGIASLYLALALVRLREAIGMPPDYRAEPNRFFLAVLPVTISAPALLFSVGMLAFLISEWTFESQFDTSPPEEGESEPLREERRKQEAQDYFDRARVQQEGERYSRAFELFQRAAEFGHPEANFELALLHLEEGHLQDYNLALNRLNAAERQGHVEASYRLGRAYRHGEFGVEPDYELAHQHLKKAAEEGHTEAQTELGHLYNRGQGVEPSAERAFHWFLQAAEQGDLVAKNDVGIFYLNGNGVERSVGEGTRWIQMAAKEGLTVAEYNLGRALYDGELVPQDYEEAFVYFNRLADKNIPYGFRMIGLQYLHGHGVEQDDEAAFDAFGEGAGRGDAESMYRLAVCYFEGIGTEPDASAALHYLMAAVDQGHAKSQYRLAQHYLTGKTILQDKAGAAKLFRAAAANGISEAAEALEALEPRLSQDEQADASLRFDAYKQKVGLDE